MYKTKKTTSSSSNPNKPKVLAENLRKQSARQKNTPNKTRRSRTGHEIAYDETKRRRKKTGKSCFGAFEVRDVFGVATIKQKEVVLPEAPGARNAKLEEAVVNLWSTNLKTTILTTTTTTTTTTSNQKASISSPFTSVAINKPKWHCVNSPANRLSRTACRLPYPSRPFSVLREL